VTRAKNINSKGTPVAALPSFACRANSALSELEQIVSDHERQLDRSISLGAEEFLKAEKAIDELRHAEYKLQQRSPPISFESAKCYEKGHSWLLSVSDGVDHADALLWQFTTRHEDTSGNLAIGSRQLWPPTARAMTKTRSRLTPKRGLFHQTGEIEFGGCKHDISELREMHRNWAIKELNTKMSQNHLSTWEKSLMGMAITRSAGDGPAILRPPPAVGDESGEFALGSDSEDEDQAQGSSRH
jgi:hypothetical protein